MEIPGDVIPHVRSELLTRNARAYPHPHALAPYLPSTGGVVALRAEHVLGALGELERVHLNRLPDGRGVTVQLHPEVELKMREIVVRPYFVPEEHVGPGRAVHVELQARSIARGRSLEWSPVRCRIGGRSAGARSRTRAPIIVLVEVGKNGGVPGRSLGPRDTAAQQDEQRQQLLHNQPFSGGMTYVNQRVHQGSCWSGGEMHLAPKESC